MQIRHIVRNWLRHQSAEAAEDVDDSMEDETLGDAVFAMLQVEAKNDRNRETGVEVVSNARHVSDQARVSNINTVSCCLETYNIVSICN